MGPAFDATRVPVTYFAAVACVTIYAAFGTPFAQTNRSD